MSGLLQRALRGHGPWAVADQAILSLGNFVVAIEGARHLSPEDLGVFGILIAILITANVAHGAAVGLPLMVLGGRRRSDVGDLSSAGLALTAMLAGASWVAIGVAAVLVDRPALVLPAGFALVAALAQETLRRSLFARVEFRRAMIGDSVSYLGQAAFVGFVAVGGGLTLEAIFTAMGVTSLAGFAIQYAQVRPHLAGGVWRPDRVAALWQLGRRLLVVHGVGIASINAVPWLLGALSGVEPVGELQALLTVLGLVNPLMLGVSAAVATLAAEAQAEPAPERRTIERDLLRRYGAGGGVVLLAYCALVVAAPGVVLDAFFGAGSVYRALTAELRVLLLFPVAQYTFFVLGAVLTAREDTRSLLAIQVIGAAIVVAAGVPLIATAGLVGAVLTLTASAVIRAVVASGVVARRS